jgi:hypothetical protein
MKRKNAVLVCLLVLSFGLSCRLVESLSGNESAGTVENLWADVPAIDDATKSDLAIPLGARLLIRTMMQGKVNFIAFTTSRSAQEVRDFYNRERMLTSGWKAGDTGCIGDNEEKSSQGVVCFFNRKDNFREEGLAIIVAQDEKTNQTDIFYVRIDMTEGSKTQAER